ncbi:MAG: S26 family signal peptidase [Armatimonadota bacterium]
MQCPRCGFENMPGRQVCAVCSTQLTVAAQRESVIPPRAKNRTIGQRIRWMLENRQMSSVAKEKARNANKDISSNIEIIRSSERSSLRTFWSDLRMAWNNMKIAWSWVTLRNLWLLMISIIPGFGYIFCRRNRLTGLYCFGGSIAALLIALALYKTFIADILVLGIAAASIISISVAADSIAQSSRDTASRRFSRIGITLIVISFICTSYMMISYIPVFPISQANVLAQPLTNAVTSGDSVILWNGDLKRSDVIVGRMVSNLPGIGVVTGLPGDRVQILNDGTVCINEKPVQTPGFDQRYPADPNSVQYYSDKIIPNDEILVTQTIRVRIGRNGLTSVSGMGYVKSENIRGRVVAIAWPPSHRKLIRVGHLNY